MLVHGETGMIPMSLDLFRQRFRFLSACFPSFDVQEALQNEGHEDIQDHQVDAHEETHKEDSTVVAGHRHKAIRHHVPIVHYHQAEQGHQGREEVIKIQRPIPQRDATFP